MTYEPICFECDQPLPKGKRHLTYCSIKCFRKKNGQRDRQGSDEDRLQLCIEKARNGDTEAQEILRYEYNITGLLRGSGYRTVEEAEENTVRF